MQSLHNDNLKKEKFKEKITQFHQVYLTDAVSLTSTEWKEAVWMSFLNIFRQKVIWVEFLGIFPPNVWSAMECVKVNDECYASRYLIIVYELKEKVND